MECTHLHCFILLFTLMKLLIIILLFISEGFFLWFLLQQCCRSVVNTHNVVVCVEVCILQVFVYMKLNTTNDCVFEIVYTLCNITASKHMKETQVKL